MTSKIVFALVAVVIAAASAQAQPTANAGAQAGPGWAALSGGWSAQANPWIPPWVAAAPWYPQWTPCTAIGSTCVDCSTKLVCTKVGGLQRACTDPTLPYCNLGQCSATPTAECAPVAAVPASGSE